MDSNKSRLLISKFQLFPVLCALVMVSCVNDLPYDAEIGLPKLVLNALLQPDSTLTVTVSRTVHFLDTDDPQRLADATVTATVNGADWAFAYDDSTRSYRSDYVLRSGDVVTLTATHHSIGTATATAQVMGAVPLAISQLVVQPFTVPGDPVSLSTLNDVDSAMLVSLYIDDPVDEANYYRLTMDYYGTYRVRYPEGIYGESAVALSSDEGYYISDERFYPHYLLTESSSRLITESESASQLLGGLFYLSSENAIIFSDERLRSAGAPIVDFLLLRELPRSSADMTDPEFGGVGYPYNDFIFPADTVSNGTYHYHFMLESLSEDYYRYLSTVSSYEGIGNLVSEPARIHSNVSTGVGIVGSYAVTTLVDSIAVDF